MVCPTCRRELQESSDSCPTCAVALAGSVRGPRPSDGDATAALATAFADPDATTPGDDATRATSRPLQSLIDDAGWRRPAIGPAADPDDSGPLRPGRPFGSRYHVIRQLGLGGMGAVYQAWDTELSVAVAIKVIRPEAMREPSAAADLERRFKRELLLARQVTHKNVVRIHDLGEIDGIKYITMSYIDGIDLASLLKREGRLSVPRALEIFRSFIPGVVAAHQAGVVHRDLKPGNIMIGKRDDALVMDFGIALSTGARDHVEPQVSEVPHEFRPTLRGRVETTLGGPLVGTLHYMAPEQARGERVDQRADIYAVGLILYDMLLGRRRAEQAASAMAELEARMVEAPPAPRSIAPEIPSALSAIVARCIDPEPARRFQTSTELVAALDRVDAQGETLPVRRVIGLPVVAALIGALVMLGAAGWYYQRQMLPPPEHAPLAVLVADFDNRVNDPLFQGTLEQAVGIGVEGASFITAYPRRDALRVAGQIGAGAALTEPAARLVAQREGIPTVLSGYVERRGARYQVGLKAIRPDGTVIAESTERAADKQEVLRDVGNLAVEMRRALGDSEPLKPGEAESFTTVSLEAAHAYALGQDNQGRPAEAMQRYQEAVALDANLGRAYAGLAVANVNLKRQAEAGEYYRKALSLVDRMSEREKYRTLGTYHLTFTNNYEEAVQTLNTLVKLYPADAAGWNNLATAYSRVGDMASSLAASRRASELSPNNLARRYNFAANAMLAGEFPTAIEQATRIVSGTPSFVYAYLPLALSTAIQGNLREAEAVYARLGAVGPDGASLSAMGIADLRLFAGRHDEAQRLLTTSIAADERANSGERAQKLIALAEAHLAVGRQSAATLAAIDAMKVNEQDEGIQFLAARVLVETGQLARAQAVAESLEKKLQKAARSLALMIRGDLAMKQRRIADAVDAYRAAQAQHDSWISHVLLGRAYVDADHFAEALTELDVASKRIGEATDLFGTNTTTLRYVPPAFYWLGRAQEGLGARDASRKSYERYVAMRGQGRSPDELLADARQRLQPR